MKRFTAVIFAALLALSPAACGKSGEEYNKPADRLEEPEKNEKKSDAPQNGGGDKNGSPDGENGLSNPPQDQNDTPATNNKNTSYAQAKAGDIIEFGGFNWLVLDVDDGKALIIAKSVIEQRAYHNAFEKITWEKCDLRQYLNGEFYDSTFAADEKKLIAETNVINGDNPEYGTPGGNETTDKIFLLSIDEANNYFADDAARTAYDLSGTVHSWWLRSPGSDGDRAARVRDGGDAGAGGDSADRGRGGVRPALWLNLQS